MEFFTNLIKLTSSFLSQTNFRVLVEGEMSTQRDMKSGETQGSILSPKLYNLYINDTLQTTGINLPLFADGTSLYTTEHKKDYVLRKNCAGDTQQKLKTTDPTSCQKGAPHISKSITV
jgi:hypothetical protein